MATLKTAPGQSSPVGATVDANGVNFCLYSKNAAKVELQFFDRPGDATPAQSVPLNSEQNRTYDYWHIHVSGVKAGQLYGYRVWGPRDPQQGFRYDPEKLLVDPYSLAVANTERYSRAKASAAGNNAAFAMKSIVVDPSQYDWEGDEPLRRPFIDALIYELHVGGFTRNPNSGVTPDKRGTYLGLIEKIPYLVDLGVKTVELMPVQQFDGQAAPTGTNYWGYQPVAWFAPHREYSSKSDLLGPVDEFRDLVKALHRAGIEVILDVVFNHTAETDEYGPTLSLRGIDNSTYYLLDSEDQAKYIDDTGCGNTSNGNHPVVRRLILDCLRYWVEQMHVDGFRFDLAASLSRGIHGQPLARPPLLLDIESEPSLAGTKIIAEAWDAGGLYEVADFAGDRWAVWNGRFRDTVRRFVKSDPGVVGTLADCIVASANMFHQPTRLPSRSINFITAHDGFTLNDLVSYDNKHNEANGEQNRDGTDDNFSWNCGVEGSSNDPQVESLRQRQIKNFLTILLLSQGRPMLLMGDEVRRSQGGNNNAYCQDNPLSWFDWEDLKLHPDMRRFVRGLIQFHQNSDILRDHSFWGEPDATTITWHGTRVKSPNWNDDSYSLAYELYHDESREHLHVMLNAYWEPMEFALPETKTGKEWRRLVDTALESPQDFCDPPAPIDATQKTYSCRPRSSVVLVDHLTD